MILIAWSSKIEFDSDSASETSSLTPKSIYGGSTYHFPRSTVRRIDYFNVIVLKYRMKHLEKSYCCI